METRGADLLKVRNKNRAKCLTMILIGGLLGSVLEQRYQVKFILGQKIGKCGDDDQTLLCVLMKPVLTEIIQKNFDRSRLLIW